MSTSTDSRVNPTDRPQVQPIMCASWCEEGDGHAEAFHPDDQWCRSVDARLVVSREPAWELLDGGTGAAEATVYAAQTPGREPHVTIVNHNDQGMELTPHEARTLARWLEHFAWVAERDHQVRLAFQYGQDVGRDT